MTEKPPLTPAEHIARAKEELANGDEDSAEFAIGHALVAIAELISSFLERFPRGPVQTNVNTACSPMPSDRVRVLVGIYAGRCGRIVESRVTEDEPVEHDVLLDGGNGEYVRLTSTEFESVA